MSQTFRFLNTAVGIEIEVEQTADHDDVPLGWIIQRDESLRNNGKEYVTFVGTLMHELPERLSSLSKLFKKYGQAGYFVFNERTSVHIHVDIRKFSDNDIRNLIILYTLFEDSLFEFAGPTRKHNIFCVPLRYTAISETVGDTVQRTIEKWSKYCAINFSRAGDIGTVEFRHMEGNLDVKRILTWASLLVKMVDFARTSSRSYIENEIANLKYMSHYNMFAEQVFGSLAKHIQIVPEEFDQAVSDAKIIFSMRA